MSEKKLTLAFDMGGTKTACAVVASGAKDFRLLDYKKAITPQTEAEILQKFLEEIEFYRARYSFTRVGIALAGQIDADGKTVISSPNLALGKNFPLAELLQEKTDLAVELLNDVKAFARGEDAFGQFPHLRNALFVAIGTGIGGAIKVNGEFYRGAHQMAGEFGHMAVAEHGEKCSCGRLGCWERYAAGLGMQERYEKQFGVKKNAKEIILESAVGTERQKTFLAGTIRYIALGIANLVNVFDPEMVIMGGSITKAPDFLEIVAPLVREEVLPPAREVHLELSTLGDDAYLVGAAL